MRKTVVGLIAAVVVVAMGTTDVSAAQLTKNTVVYITKTGSTYHLKSDCSSCDSKRTYAKTLYDILNSGNYKMCKTCAKEYGVNINDSQNLTLDMLPYELGSNVTSSGTEEVKENEGSNGSQNNGDSKDNSANTSENGNNGGNNNASEVTNSGSETSGNESKDSKSQNTQSSDNNQTSKNTQKTTKSTNSSNSSGVKELMSQKQRRNKFLSKTNPKRGSKPKTDSRPDNDGYAYADFARFNSYNSDNGLGGTPIYLSGKIKDIQPVKEYGSEYSLAIMVDDSDGYQWYMRCICSKSKYDTLKVDLLGKDGVIYGTYAGYSGVTNRPMMDILRVVDANGNDMDMSIYR